MMMNECFNLHCTIRLEIRKGIDDRADLRGRQLLRLVVPSVDGPGKWEDVGEHGWL